MSDDKIRVSWDEVSSPQVDAELKRQQILGRVQEHQNQQHAPQQLWRAPVVNTAGATRPKASIWHNSVAYMALFGLAGAVPGAICLNIVFWNEKTQEPNDALAFLGMSMLGVFLACALGSAEAVMSRNYPEIVKSIGIGAFTGFIANIVYSIGATIVMSVVLAAFEADSERAVRVLVLMIARAAAWLILGAGVGIVPGLLIWSAKKSWIGLVGGALGGFVGGLCFDPLALVIGSAGTSRLIGLCAVGTFSGAAIGLIENVAKTGWLRVVEGLIRGKQFIFYKNPTYIGSSPQCEIYLFKDAAVSPRHAAIHAVGGRFEIENLGSHAGTIVNGALVTRTRLRDNDSIQIGSTVFEFHEKAKTA